MTIKKICFITSGYPSEQKVKNAFVETLVNAFADMGVECTVISPQSITECIKNRLSLLPYKRERLTTAKNKVPVYSPRYISASSKKIGGINTAELTLFNFRRAAFNCFKKLHKKEHFQAVYGHFIFESGITANYIGKKFNLPAFFAYGENTTYTIDYLGTEKTRKLLQGINGVISVSSDNKRILLEHGLAKDNIIGVFPNSIDSHVFYQKDKSALRQRYGFPEDAFIIAFVGRFLPVKGPDRLSQAIREINNPKIASFFIGSGSLLPKCSNILFQGALKHGEICDYLSMADIFVLPTLAEGCCNAIIEAMACGLPVVSSNLPFNDDILDETNSIKIDPTNIEDIKNAITLLYDNAQLRAELAKGAISTASRLNIDNRAKNILEFINKTAL